MDRKCIFTYVTGITALVLSNINGTETTEHYCTSEGNWKSTMSTCFEHGGTPVSYLDLVNGTELRVKEGTTVWTADYFFFDYVKDVPQITADYNCGYTRLRERYNSFSKIYTYTPRAINYDICTRKRPYLCEISSGIFNGRLTATWPEAHSSCNPTSKYTLWKGYKSVSTEYQLNTSAGFWVNSARRFVRDTLSSSIHNNRHVLNCGTSHGVLKREGHDTCNRDLQGICKLEHKITDTRFSRSCLQETVTEIFNSKKTSTTAKPSTQSTLTSTMTEPSAQSMATIIEPSSQPTVISTRFMNKFGFQSTPDGLSKTTITGIITATVAFYLSCIVTVSLLLYFCRKRQKRNEANTKVVQFKHDRPPTASVVLNRVSDHDEAEVGAHYEIVPDNIQPVYINERADVHLEVLAPADYENAYVNNMREAYYEVVPDNKHVSANEREDDRYDALVRVKESVYVNETPEGRYEGLVPDNTESV